MGNNSPQQAAGGLNAAARTPKRARHRFLTTVELAHELRVSDRTLEQMRRRGDGPCPTRIGLRRVLYDRQAIELWLATRRERPRSVAA